MQNSKKYYNQNRKRNRKNGEKTTCKNSFVIRGNFADKPDGAPVDDDTNYTVLYQKLIDIYGFDFTPDDVSSLWLKMQPKDAFFEEFEEAHATEILHQNKEEAKRWEREGKNHF